MSKRLVALLGVAALVLAACQPGTPTNAPTSSGGTGGSPAASGGTGGGGLAKDQIFNIWCCAEDPRSLQPQGASGSDEISILGAVNRGLMYYNQDLSLRPELAEAPPEVSSDGLTYTFKLKAGLKYSNGDPIVAADFVRAVRVLADPRNAFDYGYEACWIAGADDAMGSDFCPTDKPTPTDDAAIDAALDKLGVSAPDETTVVYKLAQPVNFFPNLTAMWLFTPVNEKSTKFADAGDFISSGPFMIDTWTHNSEIVLKPNPNWGGAAPTLTEIHIAMGGDPEAALATYEQGGYDTVVVPGTSTRRVGDDPNLSKEMKDLPQLALTYFDFQTCQVATRGCPTNEATKDKKSPSSYKNFRIALTQAVNKQELIDQTFGGLGVVSNGAVMPGIPGWPDDYDPYKFDVAAAKATMAKALDDMGITSDPKELGLDPAASPAPTADDIYTARVHKIGRMKFGYNCNAGHEQRVFYLYDAWRNALGFAGSQFDISCTDFGTFRTERRAGNVYDIQRNGWGADFPHPDNQLRDLFACGAGNNNNSYCNKDFDALLAQAAAETDPTKAHDLYVKAQRIVVDDAAVLFMRYGVTRYLLKPYVDGITATASDHQNIGDVFYETIKILEH